MHYLLTALIFFSSALAHAATLRITIPDGPALTKLAGVCDLLKVEMNDPAMTNEECARRFIIMGAREYHNRFTVGAESREKAQKIIAERVVFDTVLPLPTPVPTPEP